MDWPNVRSGWVPQKFNIGPRPGMYAGTAPLESIHDAWAYHHEDIWGTKPVVVMHPCLNVLCVKVGEFMNHLIFITMLM